MGTLFKDRREAGHLLAERLKAYTDRPSSVVLGIPRGGVPVAFEVAQTLHLPLDVYIVRKLGVPGQEELAMGALAHGGVYVLDQPLINALHIPEHEIQTILRREQKELTRREKVYRQTLTPPAVAGKTVILIDDGLATGSSMRVAIRLLRRQRAGQIIVGVPVAPQETCESLQALVDELVCVRMLEAGDVVFAIGWWYEDFSQTSDEEVCRLLQLANNRDLRRAA